jgi:hypothetical protein
MNNKSDSLCLAAILLAIGEMREKTWSEMKMYQAAINELEKKFQVLKTDFDDAAEENTMLFRKLRQLEQKFEEQFIFNE